MFGQYSGIFQIADIMQVEHFKDQLSHNKTVNGLEKFDLGKSKRSSIKRMEETGSNHSHIRSIHSVR